MGFSLAAQPDGKVIVAGVNGLELYYRPLLVRFDSDGVLDTTFGTGGAVTYGNGPFNEAFSVAIQSDGKALVGAGSGLLRYSSDGTLDTTFGVNGRAKYPHFNTNGYSVAIQPDGKALVAGGNEDDLVLLRFNTNGTLDTTFGTDGEARYGNSSGRSVAIQSDGKPLVVGKRENDIILLRFNTDGTLDATFGTDGASRYDSGTNDYGYFVAIQSDNKAIVGGVTRYFGDVFFDFAYGYGDLLLLRYE